MIQNSGYVSIIGAPNVGKSTLLNTLLGQKRLRAELAIVTPKPQTTRNQIRGILTTDTHQMIFVDTPGLMAPKYRLQSEMVRTAYGALHGADVVLFVIDVARPAEEGIEERILERLRRAKIAATVLVLNKVDLVPKPTLLPMFDDYREKFEFADMIPISAKTADGVARSFLRRFVPICRLVPNIFRRNNSATCQNVFLSLKRFARKLCSSHNGRSRMHQLLSLRNLRNGSAGIRRKSFTFGRLFMQNGRRKNKLSSEKAGN